MAERPDPDLPGDASFSPVTSATREVTLPNGRVALVEMITISPVEQAILHHNQLRYYELSMLRMGMPNQYESTSYRH